MIKRKNDLETQIRSNVRGGKGDIPFVGLFKPEETSGKVLISGIFTFAPGDSIGVHPHSPDGEIYLMLEGELACTENGREDTLFEGDTMWIANGDTHSVENKSDKPAKMLAVVIA